MNIVKVIDGKAILMDDKGRTINTIVNHSAIDADLSKDSKIIAIVSKDGKANLYNERGQTINNLMNHSSKSIKISNDEVLLTLENNRINVYDLKGKLKKQI
jgi:WD40 repeat protein